MDVHHQISGGIFKGLLHRFYTMFTSHEEQHCEACEVTHKMSSMSLEELCEVSENKKKSGLICKGLTKRRYQVALWDVVWSLKLCYLILCCFTFAHSFFSLALVSAAQNWTSKDHEMHLISWCCSSMVSWWTCFSKIPIFYVCDVIKAIADWKQTNDFHFSQAESD